MGPPPEAGLAGGARSWFWRVAAAWGSTAAASTCFLCSGVMTCTLWKIATAFGFSLSAPFLRLLLRRSLIVAVPL